MLLDSSVFPVSANEAQEHPRSGEVILSVSDNEDTSWCYFLLKKKPLTTLNDIFLGVSTIPHETDSNLHYRCNLKTFVYTAREHTYKKQNYKYDEPDAPSENKIMGGGMLFVKASQEIINKVLLLTDSHVFPAIDFASKETARIPDNQMEMFINVYETFPNSISIANHSLYEYSQQHKRVRITAGVLSGAEGYIVRLHKDRHFVFCFGSLTLAISGAHKFPFEVVE